MTKDKPRKSVGINAKKIRAGDYLAYKHYREGWAILDYHKTSPEYRIFEQYIGDPIMASLIQRLSFLARLEGWGKYGGVAQGISPPANMPENGKGKKQYLIDFLDCHRNTILHKLDQWRVHFKFKSQMGKLTPSTIDFDGKLFATFHNPAFKIHSVFWYFNPAKTSEINDAVVRILADSHADYLDSLITFDPDDDADVRVGKAKLNASSLKLVAPAINEKQKQKPVDFSEEVLPAEPFTTDGVTFVDCNTRSLEVQYVYMTKIAKSPEYEAETLLEKIRQNSKNFKFSMMRIEELRSFDTMYLGENDEWPCQ